MSPPTKLGELGLSILGVASEYPPYATPPSELGVLAKKFYPDTPAMQKVLSINDYTGIENRSSVGTSDHELVNQTEPPSITRIHDMFMTHGVPIAVTASRKAIVESGIDLSEITHIVSTTCTDSANPGFDHFVAKGLGITHQVEKVLLHGVGCSGGLAVLRTAANLALGHSFRGKPARILCVALEVTTTFVRSELESINELQETRIGVCLFSDCASAVVLSNGIGEPAAEPIYELLGWEHSVVPETEGDLGFDVHPLGWKVVLSAQVPKLTQQTLAPSFAALLEGLPPLPKEYHDAADFDWAMHPGGATILTGAERAMNITPEHMRASYDTYMKHGNSSSATIFSVLDRLRQKDMDAVAPQGRVRDYIVGCAFGPGITVEMCMLKRNLGPRNMSGLHTPPESDSEAGRSEDGESVEWSAEEAKQASAAASSTTTQANEAFVEEALASVDLD